MDMLVGRWKNAINNTNQELKNSRLQKELSQKKEKQNNKSKAMSHSIDAKSSTKKLDTPKKKIKSQEKTISQYTDMIIQTLGVNATDKQKNKVKVIIEDLVQQQAVNTHQKLQENKESTISMQTVRLPQKFYNDLEKRYYDSEKQKHFFKNKSESLSRKCESYEREIQKNSKINKLIDNCLKREDQYKEEIKHLKKQVDISEKRLTEQQKIFRKQILTIHELISSIKSSLPHQMLEDQ